MNAIKDYMMGHPYTIQYDETASAAEKFMASHKIRHMPVVDGKKIMGIISERDIVFSKNVYKNRQFEGDVLVKDICLFEDCIVNSNETLSSVALKMSKYKLDAVVVVENKIPIGIFTSTDALRLLSELQSEGGRKKGFFGNLFK